MLVGDRIDYIDSSCIVSVILIEVITMRTGIIVSLIVLLLSGCTSTPQLMLTEKEYEEIANGQKILIIRPKRSGFSQAVQEVAKSLGISTGDVELEVEEYPIKIEDRSK